MARIVLATMGSLGDLHPKLALGLELRRRGHEPVICTWSGYAEKVDALGFEFRPLRPNVDPTDRDLHRRAMDLRRGPEVVIKETIFPHLHEMYDDLVDACREADALITGEIVYAGASVAEMTGIKLITTSLAPLSMFSFEDPNVYPSAEFLEMLRPLPSFFHRGLFEVMKLTIGGWYGPYREFRRSLGLSEDHEPIFADKFSSLLHLAMFSSAIGARQTDWPTATVQTGFCFYDESETGEMSAKLAEFLDAGEPPIVFTLGSAAVMDAGDFFDESVKAAKTLGRRALLLYGRENEPPVGLTKDIAAFQYAPYSQVFARAACVVHQAGIGTTAQVLRAGVPHLIVPFSHDQPDNAARARRSGVAEIVKRSDYNAGSAVTTLRTLLGDPSYAANAAALKLVVDGERGTAAAGDAIEEILR